MIDRRAYQAVIASTSWRQRRTRLIQQRGPRCQRCGKTWAPGFKPTLDLHHLTYERLGSERDSDLELVCQACHASADAQRATEARARAEEALYEARLDGWLRARYGDSYEDLDVDTLIQEEDRFQDFLDDNDDD